ncbi:hypothetical protein GL218_05551 [Daldinia childiae]|uniref:uncharacterized protein n=1 Tax=Daldinia childiae TaxID=326645 RepID=UPI001446FA60|nr:uncharacterized protein GL218_05551 [Daldinia childiae]KAF3058462.1 hypothetical protein GL218_05551 [Daldinia childiae]
MPLESYEDYIPTENDLYNKWLEVGAQFINMLPGCHCTCEHRLISIWPREYVAYADTPEELDRLENLDLFITVLKIVVYTNQFENTARLKESIRAAAQTLGNWRKYIHCELYSQDGTLMDKAVWKPTIHLSHPGMVSGSNIEFQFKPFES